MNLADSELWVFLWDHLKATQPTAAYVNPSDFAWLVGWLSEIASPPHSERIDVAPMDSVHAARCGECVIQPAPEIPPGRWAELGRLLYRVPMAEQLQPVNGGRGGYIARMRIGTGDVDVWQHTIERHRFRAANRERVQALIEETMVTGRDWCAEHRRTILLEALCDR